MIRLELANNTSAPKAVREAYASWEMFRTASMRPVPGMEGVYAITISEDEQMRAYFRALLKRGGTEADIKWLVSSGAMSGAHYWLWADEVTAYAEASLAEVD